MRKIYYYRHRCNSLAEVEVAKLLQFDGVEFDVFLTPNGPIVGHDIHDPTILHQPKPLMLEEYLWHAKKHDMRLALNVKSNGLANFIAGYVLHTALGFRAGDFVFDLPGEEVPEYVDLGMPVFLRYSEFDIQKYHHAAGVMIDSFAGDPVPLLKRLGSTVRYANIGIIDGPLHGRPKIATEVLNRVPSDAWLALICKEMQR